MKMLFGRMHVICRVVLLVMCLSGFVFSQNLLYNGDFEVLNPDDSSMPDNWWIEYCNTIGVTTIGIDDQEKHSGTYSFKFSTIAGKTSEDCVVMPVQGPDTMYAGGLYKVSYWAKSEGAGVYNVSINALWANDQIAEPLVGTNDWTYREAILTYGADWFINDTEEFRDSHFLSLWFNADSCGEAGSAWYDDITVEYIGIPPSAPEPLSLLADYEDGNVVLNWGSATANDNPISYYLIKRVKKGAETPSICDNPSFEDPNDSFTFPNTWSTFYWASAAMEWAEDVARTGDFSVTMHTDVGGNAFISKGLFPPVGTRGFDVYMTAYIKTENVTGGSGAFIDFQSWGGMKQGLFGTNDWTADDAVMANVLPGTPCAVMYGNYYDGGGGDMPEDKTTGQAWYDDVSIVLFDSVGQASGLSFTDTNVEENETYYYTVRAVDAEGLCGDAEMASVITTGGNLLYNGDFEVLNPDDSSMPDNWWIEYCNTIGVTTIGIDDQEKHSGTYSFKFSTIAGKTSEDCVVMPVQGPDTMYAGGLYKVSYWAKSEGAGVYNVSINALWANDQIAEPLVGTNDWTYREAILTYGADWFINDTEEFRDSHFLSLWFNADSCGEAGSAWYDDITVEYIGTPPDMPKNLTTNYEDSQITLRWGSATQTSNPVKYYLIKRAKKGTETPSICVNPSFEDPNDSFTFPNTWSTFYWASAAMEWAEGVARTGDFSVTMHTDVGGNAFISKGLFPPIGTRGFDVYMKAYIKTENVTGGSGAFIDFQSWGGMKQGLFGTNDWTADDAVMANVLPGTPCAVMYGNYYDGGGGDMPEDKTTGQAWYDDVSIVLFDSVGQASGLSFTDTDVSLGETYYYTVRAVDNRGLLGDALLETVAATASIGNRNALVPMKTELVGNYPNPFNPSTTIMFNIDKSTNVQISVYNILGQKVAKVVDRNYEAGKYKVSWDASSNISSGVYLYELRAGDFTQVKKMILMR